MSWLPFTILNWWQATDRHATYTHWKKGLNRDIAQTQWNTGRILERNEWINVMIKEEEPWMHRHKIENDEEREQIAGKN